MLDTVVAVVVFVLVAAGLAWVRGRRTQRILGTEVPPAPSPILSRPLDEPGPDVAARLFSPASEAEPILPLLRDPTFDPYAFRTATRAEFERVLLGEEPEALDYSSAVGDSVTRRAPVLVLAVAAPTLAHAFADERWLSVKVTLEALVQSDAASPRRWVEIWAMRRARDAERWEITQVVDGQLRSLGEPPPAIGAHGRYATAPAGTEMEVAELQGFLDGALTVLDGGEDARLHPAFAATVTWIGEIQRRHGRTLPTTGTVTAARDLGFGREGMVRTRRVWVEGSVEGKRFREIWTLVRGETWQLGAAA